jgi:diaminopimelate decarboxylase
MNQNQIIDISKDFGSPFFYIKEKKIVENIKIFRDSFKEYKGKFSLGYSAKTNPQISVLRVMQENNVISECCSYLDMASSIKAGYSGKDIVLAGLHKSEESLNFAVKNKIKIINIESLYEATNLKKILIKNKIKIKVGVRIAFPAKTGIKSFLGVTYDRFGASCKSNEAYNLINFIVNNQECFELQGLHCHPGSNIKDSSRYRVAIDEMIKVYKYIKDTHEIEIKTINIGGGVGIEEVHFYSAIDLIINTCFRIFKKRRIYKSNGFKVKNLLNDIVKYLNVQFEANNLPYPEIMMEPGRALIGNAIDLYASIVNIKETQSGRWLIIDCGTNLLPILTLFTEHHNIEIINNNQKFLRYSIAGPLLYSSDVIAANILLRESSIGDFVKISSVGAYFNSQSSHFIFARCATVNEKFDGSILLTERKETFEDISLRNI